MSCTAAWAARMLDILRRHRDFGRPHLGARAAQETGLRGAVPATGVKHRVPVPAPSNRTWGFDTTGVTSADGSLHVVLGIVEGLILKHQPKHSLLRQAARSTPAPAKTASKAKRK